MRHARRLNRSSDGGFLVDATLLGDLLGITPSALPELMRAGEVTSLCERGEEEHQGQYRLTFFHKGRRVRLTVDEAGEVLRQSVVDFGERTLPEAMHRPGGP
ncbi:hypothetical protein BOQ54_18575 (plasmid) [Chelatococcus daeguensis]|uniref:Uncharacterized protein n=1 Tax=Chelatococcus daeguensis TaxID=444444 RepID=A0AAC9JTZ4_9HYPH|nr:DUF6522 family protein [Chelatococcus daeguensis]APF39494.1 hypothetical protein BOQ54_18575 [Chelatococcus daeguensis]